jgi:dinuclear metal center YbgI/SA1388 family protein
MKISNVIGFLESRVPRSMQEAYDNCGLLVGDREQAITGVLIALDCTPEIVEEAERTNCNLIIVHHPVIFKGLKKLTGTNAVEQTIIACIQKNIALYAIHTNLDNYQFGVNQEIGKRLGLKELRILRPKKEVLNKLIVYVPFDAASAVSEAVFSAGAGNIGNYKECSFTLEGTGTFMPVGDANPTSGELNVRSELRELRMEFLVSTHVINPVLKAMREAHPYEEVAYELIALQNENLTEGSGMYGELEKPLDEVTFLAHLKKDFNCGCIRHTKLLGRQIKRVAFCGGSGSFLLQDAKAVGADVFITGDFKYHEFFDAEEELVIADIGHYESEQFTVNLLADILTENFSTFAVRLTGINTNPINYF